MVEWNRLNDRPGESKQIKPRRRGRTVKKEVSLKRQFKKEATKGVKKAKRPKQDDDSDDDDPSVPSTAPADSTNETDAAEISLVTANQALRSQSLRGAGSGLRGLNFLPLPGAEREGQLIAAEMDSQKVNQTTFNRQAAEEAVVNGLQIPPQVLHIATHGFFLQPDQNLRRRLLSLQRGAELSIPPPGDNPLLRAGLAFAGINKKAPLLGEIDPQNDGVLTALEVLDLQLSGTQLVVLSACETGLGEIHEGEGVYGLRRAFQEAGVAEVVNSLWEVSDAGTQALMTAFYRRFMAGQSARAALRDAQLELKASDIWSSPFIWSAFMMVGSYDTSGTIQR